MEKSNVVQAVRRQRSEWFGTVTGNDELAQAPV
jgi:hypothetical protein